MSSISEVGHAKNVAHFEKMAAYVNGYGGVYQPSKTAIQLQELQRLLAEARAILLTVQQLELNKKKAQNIRAEVFKQMKPLCTRIINILRSSDAADKTVEDAIAIINKIKGLRLSKKEEAVTAAQTASETVTSEVTSYVIMADGATMPTPENENGSTPEKRTRSNAQTSQDQLIEHFSRLLILLQSEVYYSPNEPELQIGTLQMYLDSLRAANSAYIQAEVEWSNALIMRNNLLYGEKIGICDVAQDVKQYVKALFGPKNPQFKQISGLRFLKYRV